MLPVLATFRGFRSLGAHPALRVMAATAFYILKIKTFVSNMWKPKNIVDYMFNYNILKTNITWF